MIFMSKEFYETPDDNLAVEYDRWLNGIDTVYCEEPPIDFDHKYQNLMQILSVNKSRIVKGITQYIIVPWKDIDKFIQGSDRLNKRVTQHGLVGMIEVKF